MSTKKAGTGDKALRRTAGRPRSEASRTAILETAYRFLQTRPVAQISVTHVARKAGVSTATVYRWWSTKEALLLDAFLHAAGHEVVVGTEGSPPERLKGYVLQIGRFFIGEKGIAAARLLTAIQDDAALRRDFVKRVYSPRETEIRALVEEAIRKRQLPAGLEVNTLLDEIIGPLLSRLLLRHERIDERFVVDLFDRAVAAAMIPSRTR
jgi:AcrR family transcriptional regulator